MLPPSQGLWRTRATPSADRTLNRPSTTTLRRSCKQLPSRSHCFSQTFSLFPPEARWLLRRPPSFRGRGTMAPLLARRSKGKQGRSRERSPPASSRATARAERSTELVEVLALPHDARAARLSEVQILFLLSSASSHGSNDEEWLIPADDFIGQLRLWRLMRQILFAGIEPEERSAAQRAVVSNRPA